MSLTAPERETVILMNDDEDEARITTYQRKVITALRKNPSAVLVREGTFEKTAWAEFRMPAGLVSFRKKRAKLTLTPEQRQARAERMAHARSARSR